MIESLLSPPVPMAADEFYKALISVSGVLLGIAFAAMLFILQSGFSSFKYSRRMFVVLYLHFGRQLLFSLSYLTLAPFFILFFPTTPEFISFVYFFYAGFFIMATLDYSKEEGYITTLNSHKYVPRHYGKIRSYFRYINNRGFLRNLFQLTPVFLIIVYPYVLSSDAGFNLILSTQAMFYSCLNILAYTLFKVTKFVPEFFFFTDVEFKSSEPVEKDELYDSSKEKIIKEKSLLKEYLIKHGVTELDDQYPRQFLNGELKIYFLTANNDPCSHFNIYIDVKNATPHEMKSEVAKYAYHFSSKLLSSKVDINSFVLSFHVTLASDSSRNLFFRFRRSEFEQMVNTYKGDPMGMFEMKNVCIDELFR
ncbi:hypothetical protein [Photobacterium satsumensis]|uniref:hypothetical protein n=1 Tax=Photobacterium satsumensis TaxID=2910239 RepID=UPI003D124610